MSFDLKSHHSIPWKSQWYKMERTDFSKNYCRSQNKEFLLVKKIYKRIIPAHRWLGKLWENKCHNSLGRCQLYLIPPQGRVCSVYFSSIHQLSGLIGQRVKRVKSVRTDWSLGPQFNCLNKGIWFCLRRFRVPVTFMLSEWYGKEPPGHQCPSGRAAGDEAETLWHSKWHYDCT